jgi:hypothetical protein
MRSSRLSNFELDFRPFSFWEIASLSGTARFGETVYFQTGKIPTLQTFRVIELPER